EGVYAALGAGKFKNGLVFEIWDAKAFDEHGNIPIEELPKLFEDIADAITVLKDQAEQDFVKGCYYEGSLKDVPSAAKEHLAQLLKKSGYVPSKRIFLDAQQDQEAIFIYLADSDRFNIKQVWDKKQAGWDINNPEGYLNRPILGSSVTKLGILAGGEYIGKDDPVMVGNSMLMDYIFAFLKDNPVLLQGDMNGSHWLAGIPTAFKYAVANAESHPILVGLRYTLSEDGKTMAKVEDVFDSKAYSSIRKKMIRFNYEFKRACLGGQVEPYGTNWRTVEASYPLAKLLRALQAPNSRFLVKNKPAAERKSRPIGLFGDVVSLFKTATGSLDVPSAPEGWTGGDESAERFLKSALALQSKGISNKISEAVIGVAKDAGNKKVILISASVLRSDSSLILALQSINEQINQNLGVFGSTANIEANAYRFVLVADEPALKTVQDVENFFAGIAKQTKNGARTNKEIFAKILTQEDMYEGEISDATSLLEQLERMGIDMEEIKALVGSQDWTSNLTALTSVPPWIRSDIPLKPVLDVVTVNVGVKENEIAFAANALFGAIEAITSPTKQLTPALAEKLDLLELTTTSMLVRPHEISTSIRDEITTYRETVAKI
ncbi:MAG: fructose 1,6-bisphosphatase, partial [Candidatus Omnitrophica bacterium]|nr:fructose 1,6-bisphosphatase [Candidatus Omnitrophota bacterium]